MLNVEKFTFNPVQENTYIVYDDKGDCAIIDPGFYYPEEERDFFLFIEKQKLTPKLLLLTHAHFDHVFGLCATVAKTQLIPQMHPNEKMVLDNVATHAGMYGLTLNMYEGEFLFLQEKDKLQLNHQNPIQIFLTSGHSPGSLSFYFPQSEIVFTGDCLFRESVGRTDIPLANFDELCQHIQTKLYVLPNPTKVYAGHGGETTIEHEKVNNPYING